MLDKIRSLLAKISKFFKHEGITVNQQNNSTIVNTGDTIINITIVKS